MEELEGMKCEVCRGGVPTATEEEIQDFHKQVPDWTILRDGINKLQRRFEFSNFEHALKFTNAIGAVSEEEGHHPALLTEWGGVTVTWWSHEIGGLHQNDFIMAAKTDQLFSG